MIQVIGCGVTEYEPLYDRWNEQRHSRAAILQDGEKLLSGEGNDAQEGGEHIEPHNSCLRDAARLPRASSPAITASAAAFGMSTHQTLPARNTVCSTAT